HYRTLVSDADAVLRFADMNEPSTDRRYAPITWQPFLVDGMSADFVRGPGAKLKLDVRLEPTYSGVLARKVLQLAPGAYNLSAQQQAEGFGSSSRVNWRIACADEPERVLLNQATRASTDTTLLAAFTVPANCAL